MSAAMQPLASRHCSQPLAFHPLGTKQGRSRQPLPSASLALHRPQKDMLGSCAVLSKAGQGLQRRVRGSAAGAPRGRTSPGLAVRAVKQDAYVRVDPGDTLDTLAEAFQVPRSEFVACNRDLISSENLIYEGDLLRVPGEAWKGVAPPGLEGRIVLRTPGTLGDALATVGTALQLLPSYLGLGPGARLPAGTGGWLMLGGALMVALGAVGRLRRGAAAAESPTSAATLARVRGVRAAEEAEAEAVPWALLGSVKLKSYATPGLPPNMRGPYTGTFQNPDNLPNQLMQASILEADQKAPATEEAAKEALVLTPQPVLAAAAATTPASPAKEAPVDPPTPSAAASGTATAVKAEKEAAGETGKKAPTEHRKLRKEKEAPKHSPAAVPPLGLASAEKAVVAAAAPATSQSAPAPAAATAVPPPPAEAEAPAVPASGGWKFPSISFGKDSTTTIFRFGQDTSTPEASASAAEAATGPSTSASSASTDSSTSPSPGSSKSQAGAWGPYTLGWAGSQSEGGDGKQGGAKEEEELTVAQKAVKSAIPALALGAGAASFVTGGWPGAMEAVGLTFLVSFVGYDLLWADKREQLIEEVKGIRSPADVARFLENRSISPKW